ncbi:hypothetical protein C6P40_000363 [Pichia californica]|uniref:Metallo-beta-lactamase domain-containing protein n=1 Tax=Pichia californica TaxID=460514 RepID=A0A9P7BGM0_9ASCO|nr:hypothetical protein C6P42_000345 [[Candida] californica]KAG0688924.1 hypothetical protein C6P40_000363 [[Candida] californica]
MSKAYAEGPQSIIPASISNVAPEGTKVFILKLGNLEADASYFFEHANVSLKSTKDEAIVHERKNLQMYTVLIDHPISGLILYEVGPGKIGWESKWGAEILDAYCRVNKDDETQPLDIAIKNAGYDINNVKHIIIGHLHIDHAGGLEYFKGRTDVTVWVHEIELKHAVWGIATKSEIGSYLNYYIDLDLNWSTFNEQKVDIFKGLTVHLCPGHTPGLIILQINLPSDGTIIFTTDHTIFKENYENGGCKQGFLMRDHYQWYNSTQMLRRLHRDTNALVIFGHDTSTVEQVLEEKTYFN